MAIWKALILFSHSLHPNISRSRRKYSVKVHVVFQMSRNPGKRDLYTGDINVNKRLKQTNLLLQELMHLWLAH